jgi:hypothetical protein
MGGFGDAATGFAVLQGGNRVTCGPWGNLATGRKFEDEAFEILGFGQRGDDGVIEAL